MRWLQEHFSANPLTSLVLLSLLLFLSGNWILPLMDRDEPRFAEASREMLERKDPIIPWFNGQYRFDKPPLIYWCQMACYKALGENAFAARLPSVLFGTATAALLVFWGRRLGNKQAGLIAGLMLITCLQFLIHARLAVADMPMVFFVALALWSGWEMTRPALTASWKWWWIFYVSLGFGFLAKGPVAWVPMGGLFLGRWLRPQEFKLRVARTILGLLVMLLLVGLWGIPALIATKGEFFRVGIGHHVIFRSFGIMEGHGGPGWVGFILTLPLYLLTFFFSFFPWALRVPGALRRWWPARDRDLLGWYLLTQAAVVFAVFTVVRTKLPHYTLPAFPALSLWLALQISPEPQAFKWLFPRVAAMCALTLLLTLSFFRAAEPAFVAASLWHQAQAFTSPSTKLATIGFNEPSPVWEFRREITNYVQQLELEQAGPFLQKPGNRILILPTGQISDELKTLSKDMVTLRAKGIDTARFRRIDLTALVKTSK